MGAGGGSQAMCRKEGLFPWTVCLLQTEGGGRCAPRQMLWGVGAPGALALVPHPLFWAVGKSLHLWKFGSFLHPKHKSQAKQSGLSVGRGEPSPAELGLCLPKQRLLPLTSPSGAQVQCDPGRTHVPTTLTQTAHCKANR